MVTSYAYGGNFGHYYETWKDDERMGLLHRFQLRSLNDHEDAVRRRPQAPLIIYQLGSRDRNIRVFKPARCALITDAYLGESSEDGETIVILSQAAKVKSIYSVHSRNIRTYSASENLSF